jgi:hypothetical protein
MLQARAPAARAASGTPLCRAHLPAIRGACRAPRRGRRRGAAAAAAAAGADGAGTAGAAPPPAPPPGRDPKTPWHFGAQTNERLLQWDAGAQAQLTRIWLCGQLGVERDQLDARLAELANLLPDMVAKLHALKAPLVLELLQARRPSGDGAKGWSEPGPGGARPPSAGRRGRAARVQPRWRSAARGAPTLTPPPTSQDMPGVAARLLELRSLLPGADVSAIVAQRPELLLRTPVGRAVKRGSKRSPMQSAAAGGTPPRPLSPTLPPPSSHPPPAAQMADLRAAVEALARHLPGVAVGPLVAREPLLLRADVAQLLAEVQRLMPVRGGAQQGGEWAGRLLEARRGPRLAPLGGSVFCRAAPIAQPLTASPRPPLNPRRLPAAQGKDPVATLVADPGAFIDMEAAGLPSTLEYN